MPNIYFILLSFCDFSCFFVIFVILNGNHYAQIKRPKDKTINKNTPMNKQMTKQIEVPIFLSKSANFPVPWLIKFNWGAHVGHIGPLDPPSYPFERFCLW